MASSYPLKPLSQPHNLHHVHTAEPHSEQKLLSRDDADLAHFGKRPQLRRYFGMVSIIGLTCTLMITWEGVLIVFAGGFTNGGPTGLVGGYLFSWGGTFLQVLVMSEMGSMIPLAGGQYNWVAILAPKSMNKFLSYLTGWITVIGWQAISASGALLCSTLIQGLAVLNNPTYVPTRWQATLIFYAITFLALLINTYLARLLPKIEATILVLHVLGFFGVLLPLVYLGPHGAPSTVFATFLNLGAWRSDAVSFFIGSVSTMFAFMGIDGATHMAEEIENAAAVIPRSMLVTVALNGALGFAMLLATLFCLGDLDAAMHSPTGFPFIAIFEGALQSAPGATALVALVLVTVVSATVGVLATCSRMIWAFARERGLPFSSYIARVEPRTALPLYSIGLTVVLNLLLALINIGSTVAFNALTGLTIASFYASFTIAAVVMLHKRLTTPESQFRWGPFRLGRWWGPPVYVAAIVYSVIGWFFSFWPPTAVELTAQTMNWSSVVFGGTLILAMGYWAVWARRVYTGPIVEVHMD
ncbi:amino acid/polyamine transporter I [Geopyxis carbonaria]|nr:amino acid/polyamine transporter I [Geopyxis carbonaria]